MFIYTDGRALWFMIPAQNFYCWAVNFKLLANVSCNVTHAAEADEELVRLLYSKYGAGLLNYVTGLTGDRQRAEDLVQETLLRVWRHPEVLTSTERSPRAWLFTVARNLATDAHRAQSVRIKLTAEAPPRQELANDGGIDAALTHFEMLDALDGLSHMHREVLVAMFYQERSVAETAEQLGIPEGTVKSRCHYALRALRILCQERGLLP